MGAAALSGCSGLVLPLPSTVAEAPSAKESQSWRYGGAWRWAQDADPKSFDPYQESSLRTLQPLASAYNRLLRLDSTQQDRVVPDLAESWTVSADGKVYTFTLHSEVQWHDGQLLSSEDVAYSLLSMADKLSGAPSALRRPRAESYAVMEAALPRDERTVEVRLSQPSVSFTRTLASGWSLITPKSLAAQKGGLEQTIKGTGPMVWKEYTPGVGGVLVRNQNYFLPDKPYLDRVEWWIIPDPKARYAAFRSGKLEVETLTPRQAALIDKELPWAQVFRQPSINPISLVFNLKQRPFSDERVRRALSLAVDRQAVLQAMPFPQGEVGGPYFPSPWALAADEVKRLPGHRSPKGPDRTEARRLLAQAGYGNQLRVPCIGGHSAEADRAAKVVQQQLQEIGVVLELAVLDYKSLMKAFQQRDFVCAIHSGSRRGDDPEDQLAAQYSCAAKDNLTHLCDDKLEALLQRQRASLDVGERKTLVLQAQRRILEVTPGVILYYPSVTTVVQPWVNNYRSRAVPADALDLQDVWLDSQR